MIVLFTALIPIPVTVLIPDATNDNSLDLFPITGAITAPDPFPPVIPIDTTFSTPKSCGSTKASTKLPLITGCITAPEPLPVEIPICGGLITS